MWGKRSDMVIHQLDPFNAEPPRAALAGEVFTGVDLFYSRNHGPIPDLDPAGWRLRVDGLVDTPLDLSLEELRGAFAEHELPATLQCAGTAGTGSSRSATSRGRPRGVLGRPRPPPGRGPPG